MKYMFVIPSLSKGGAERVVSLISNKLAENDEIVLMKFFDVKEEYFISNKVKVLNLSGSDEKCYKNLDKIQRLIKLRNFIKNENPDFVIPFLSHVRVMTYFSTLFMNVNFIHTVRVDPNVEIFKKDLKHKLSKYILLKGKKIWVQNQAQKDCFDKKYQNKIFVLPNPVSDEFLVCNKENKRHDKFNIIAVGRLKAQKNFELLIKVCHKLYEKYNNIQLDIYGEGELYNKLSCLINELKASDCVELKGRSNNLLPKYCAADLFVLSSNYEGMPNALLEAMACGVPCVSTDCPTGPNEMIIDGQNGLLVPVDDFDALFSAIESIINNYADAESMGINAKKFVLENYSVEHISNLFKEMI